jgi:hypothetical protein
MSLYLQVAGKEHLLELARDALIAEIEVPEPSGDWRADLRAIALATRGMLRRHQWLMSPATRQSWSVSGAWRDRLAGTGIFPILVGFLDGRIDPDAPEIIDQRFEFGLDCLLDGIGLRIDSCR